MTAPAMKVPAMKMVEVRAVTLSLGLALGLALLMPAAAEAQDKPRPSLPREAALANAPDAREGAFRVPTAG